MTKAAQRLCIVQPVMKAYRLPFFRQLETKLASANITLQVIYGTPWASEKLRGDNAELEAPLGQRVESHMLFKRILWIPAWRACRQADAVIVEHASKNVLNYPLAAFNRCGMQKLAYWGHGRDRQAEPDSAGERFKRRTLHWADWWFAYTSGAAEYVGTCGYPNERVTVVENAIDTAALRHELATVDDEARRARLESLGLQPHGRRLIYCGSLYDNKRIDLLMDAADRVHSARNDVQLLILGGGPLAGVVAEYAATRPWVRYIGPCFGFDKAVLLSLAELWLNPGLVGLGILDAFCARLPVLTTEVLVHSPEIEYLEHGHNGLMLKVDAGEYAAAILSLLADDARLMALRDGARLAAERYSIETMADNFSKGVTQWLQS